MPFKNQETVPGLQFLSTFLPTPPCYRVTPVFAVIELTPHSRKERKFPYHLRHHKRVHFLVVSTHFNLHFHPDRPRTKSFTIQHV